MADYKIIRNWDKSISDMHHINVEYDGFSYSVIFGRYINGGFFSIPNWSVGGDLGDYSDTFWNTESLYKALKKKKAARAIAEAIRDYAIQVKQLRGSERDD